MMTPLGVETSSNMLWSRWRDEVEEEGLVREVGSKAISAIMHAGRGRGRLSVNVDSCCWLVGWLVVQENCLALNRAKLLRKTQSDI